MKKGVLLALVLFCATTIFAQKRTVFINESFNTIDFPEGWEVKGGGQNNWEISENMLAGGEPNELYFDWTPKFIGTSRFMTHAVDMTNVTEAYLSLKHFLNAHNGENTIGVATTSDDGATWNVAWSQAYSTTGAYEINETISTPDMGKANVRFCLFFEGESNTISGWHFDDFMVLTQDNHDINLLSIDVEENLNAGNTDISFTIQNEGVTTVNTFEAKYEIEGIGSVTQTFNTNIETLKSEKFTFNTAAVIPPGTYNLRVEILSINGEEDNYINNNALEKKLNVVLGLVDRKPMIEHFSASTCPNCPTVNATMLQLTHLNQDKYTYVKYPVDWPSPGDPYHTAEIDERVYFYSVIGVPSIFLDARDMGTPISQTDLNERLAAPAYVDIKGSFTMEGNTINVIADFMSYKDIDNVNAFVVVNEKTTELNYGTTDETEWHHIMMKMLGGTEGTKISLKAGEYKRLEFSHDMSNTHMEETDDLEVALWLQNLDDREIYNSNFAYEYSEHPYPAENLQIAKNGDKLDITWENPSSNPKGYNLYVNNQLVKYNTTETSYTFDNVGEYYIVKLETLYDDMQAVSIVRTSDDDNDDGIEEIKTSFNIYPNPVDDILYIETNENINEIVIYDVRGCRVSKSPSLQVSKSMSMSMSVSMSMPSLKPGIYFINIITEKGNITKKFIKK